MNDVFDERDGDAPAQAAIADQFKYWEPPDESTTRRAVLAALATLVACGFVWISVMGVVARYVSPPPELACHTMINGMRYQIACQPEEGWR